MTDIAKLGFEVDSGAIRKAVAALDQLTRSGDATARAARGFETSISRMERQLASAAAVAGQLRDAIGDLGLARLDRSVAGASASLQRMQASLRSAAKATAPGATGVGTALRSEQLAQAAAKGATGPVAQTGQQLAQAAAAPTSSTASSAAAHVSAKAASVSNVVEAALKELERIYTEAFDKIGNAIVQAFVTGERLAIKSSEVAKAAMNDVIKSLVKFSVVDPIKALVSDAGGALGRLLGFSGNAGGAAGTSMLSLYQQFAFSGVGQALGLSAAAVPSLAVGSGAFFAGGLPASLSSAAPSTLLAATGPWGGFGSVAGAATASTGGAVGAAGLGGSAPALTTFGTIAPYLAAAAVAFALMSGAFSGPPSVGPTSVARVTDLGDPDSAVFSFDNGGRDTSVLERVIEAVSDAIADGTERFVGTLRPGSGFDLGYFPSPEKGNSQAAGINIKPIIANVLEDRDRFKGLSEQQAVDKATLIALREMVDYQSDTLDEIARNSDATSAGALVSDLEFGRNFDRLTAALDALGGEIDANSLAQAQNTVAIQARADEFGAANVAPIADGLEKALALFPGITTRSVTSEQTVRGIEVSESDEGHSSTRFVREGSAEFDRLVAAGAEVISRIEQATSSVTGPSQNYAANMERVADAIRIADASVGLLTDTVTGDFEPALRGPFRDALEQGTANLAAAAPGLEALNDQIREAYRSFPQLAEQLGPLNEVLINVAATVSQAQQTLLGNLREKFNDSLTAQINEATGLGGLNTLGDLLDARDLNRSEADALSESRARVDELFTAQVNRLLQSLGTATVTQIAASGDVTDGMLRGLIEGFLGAAADPEALAARTLERLAIEDQIAAQLELVDKRRQEAEQAGRLAEQAAQNARTLRGAASALLVDRTLSPLSPEGLMTETLRQFEEALALANDGTPTDPESQAAVQQLPDLSRNALQAARDYYGSSSEYNAAFQRIQSDLLSTASVQEGIEQQQLAVQRAMLEALQAMGAANDNRPAYVAAGNGQYVSTGAGGLPAGLDLGYKPEDNARIARAFLAAGISYTGAGEGQIGQIRAGNALADAILRNLGFADGGVFAGGNVVPFARGGIVRRATLFPLGLMGEAGPEAIMPLERGPGGALGVRASGTGDDRLAFLLVERFERLEGILAAIATNTAQQLAETRKANSRPRQRAA